MSDKLKWLVIDSSLIMKRLLKAHSSIMGEGENQIILKKFNL